MKTCTQLIKTIMIIFAIISIANADDGQNPSSNLFDSLPQHQRDAINNIKNDQIRIEFDKRTLEALRRMGLKEEFIQKLGSGDIAGNGGGRLEADFHYAYTLIPKLIKDCVESPVCPLMPDEKKILNDIWLLTVVNNTQKHKFIFLNENDAGNLFFDEHDQQKRVAVTGFERYAPIFINLDMMYSDNNVLSHLGRIVQIIIHEVGHQTGVKSHGILDALGGKLRSFFTRESIKVNNNVGGTNIEIINTNFRSPYLSSVTVLKWDQWTNRSNPIMIDITEEFKKVASCKGVDRELQSYKISNLHWGRIEQQDENYILPLKGWIDFRCEDKNTVQWTEEADFKIQIKLEYVQLPPGKILLYRGSNLNIFR